MAQVLVCLEHAALRADHVWQRLRERDAPGFHRWVIDEAIDVIKSETGTVKSGEWGDFDGKEAEQTYMRHSIVIKTNCKVRFFP